ncbi:hypothetical protein [Pectobacterium parmentieri]|uniref:hypothetical protein n=1 Tax=Pectobacterium parmentieri TaxID=1905730 RepID=UPI000CDD4041|nr:hypothetical protein [Pectobacterium parmentieri]AYH05572.1 hypothetical protein C5E25_09555 [Pectobacterium parmentieri]AYH14393.1 hypothetical protein C5E23_09525 [Pectobacterium parmentieri]AYH23095.1 hypothetical protein C5E21_09530 [Pectobacterium parmentieri]MBN3178261.1 hypothetical protein [Pectobacterium parmentieri]POW27540.1 hypothetical protein PB20LOC_02186 [Pectobacterium parmentieri]
MAHYWWKDLLDRNNVWQGLELIVQGQAPSKQNIEMLSGHHGRMSLQVRGEALFWASMLKDHSGVWLVFNADHPDQQGLLSPVTSHEVEAVKKQGEQAWVSEWCRYFARQLVRTPEPLLPERRWLLRPMTSVARSAPYTVKQTATVENWHFHSPARTGNIGCDWALYGEDFPDLANPQKVSLVDWWWGGNLLLGRYAVKTETGRLKWWRKKCREGTLPPVLVWYVAGLASFVILDGHYRLQAAIEEGIPPLFLVLSELNERVFPPEPEHQERILRALEQQQHKNPGYSVEGINQTLINLYDTRYLYASTHSRAVLGKGDSWARDVKAYLHKYHCEENLEKILNRVNDEPPPH